MKDECQKEIISFFFGFNRYNMEKKQTKILTSGFSSGHFGLSILRHLRGFLPGFPPGPPYADQVESAINDGPLLANNSGNIELMSTVTLDYARVDMEYSGNSHRGAYAG